MYSLVFFFFNDTATTEIYTLSLHDALPIYESDGRQKKKGDALDAYCVNLNKKAKEGKIDPLIGREAEVQRTIQVLCRRSEEHTSELQSRQYLVCRLLLEKKKKK